MRFEDAGDKGARIFPDLLQFSRRMPRPSPFLPFPPPRLPFPFAHSPMRIGFCAVSGFPSVPLSPPRKLIRARIIGNRLIARGLCRTSRILRDNSCKNGYTILLSFSAASRFFSPFLLHSFITSRLRRLTFEDMLWKKYNYIYVIKKKEKKRKKRKSNL